MTKLPNINCIHYEWGMCNKKPRRRFGLFRTNCPEVEGKVCTIRERHPKPSAPLPPPSKRIISEDVKAPLTEGKVRGGMGNCLKNTSSGARPIHPPIPSKKDITKAQILRKVEKKEFVVRCVSVDICPTCGYMLRTEDGGKICDECNTIFDMK